ncbi:MAG: serine protease [bacterium]
MKRILLCILMLVMSVEGYSQKNKFNTNAVVKIFNYENVELVPVGEGWNIALPMMGHGSGTMIDSSGIILTNSHVVADSRLLAVLLPGSEQIFQAEVIFQQKNDEIGEDYAFICITGTFKDYVTLPRRQPIYEQRDKVFALGYPIDFINKNPGSVDGIISLVNPDAAPGLTQMTAPINGGNSGGPVINSNEEIIGITVSARKEAEGIKYFMPIEKIINKLNEIKKTSLIDEHKNKLKNDDFEIREIKLKLIEYLTKINKQVVNVSDVAIESLLQLFLKEDIGNDLTKLILKAESNANNKNDVLADLLAISSAVSYDYAIINIQNYLKTENFSYISEFCKNINEATLYSEKAIKIDPSILMSSYIKQMESVKGKYSKFCKGDFSIPDHTPTTLTSFWEIEGGLIHSKFKYADGNGKVVSDNAMLGVNWYHTPNSIINIAYGFSFQMGGNSINDKLTTLSNMNFEVGPHFGTIRDSLNSGYFAEFLITASGFNATIPLPQSGKTQNIWGFNVYFDTFHIRLGYIFTNGSALVLNYRNLPSNDFRSSMFSLSYRFN